MGGGGGEAGVRTRAEGRRKARIADWSGPPGKATIQLENSESEAEREGKEEGKEGMKGK